MSYAVIILKFFTETKTIVKCYNFELIIIKEIIVFTFL